MFRSATVAVVLFPLLVSGQSRPSTRDDLTLHAATQEVLLDFVARDKHQRAITDLRPEDVRIYEDGVLQLPKSFRYRSGPETPAAGTVVSENLSNKYDPLKELNLISIVFESMSAQTRLRATEYAEEFLKSSVGPNTWIGVFTLNHQLSVVQPFTTDIALVRAAVRRAGTGAYQEFAKESQDRENRINDLLTVQQTSGSNPQASGNSGSAPGNFQPLSPGSAEERGPAGGLGTAAALLLQVEQHVLKNAYQQNGNGTIDALHTLIRAQQPLPGRKTVFYVSEGLVIPPERPELLQSIISEANRLNVTFYTLDARGLEVSSSMQKAMAATAAMNADDSGGLAVQQTDIQVNARALAEGTGGFAMDNSNDLRAPLQRVMEDVRAHYEVSYTPSSTNFDGHFRAIEVKVLRPGVKLQSRKGYFALPLLNGESLSIVEVEALKVLDTKPEVRAFDFETAALRFGSNTEGANYRVAISVPAKAIHFEEDKAKNTFQVHVAAMILVKQAQTSQVVARVSRDLPYRAPLARRADFERGAITILLPVSLPTGHYEIEAALLDIGGSAASVRRFAVMAPVQQRGMDVSDLVWVHTVRASQPNDTHNPADPFDTPFGQVTPEVNASLGVAASASFFFRVYDAPAPSARLKILKDGKQVTAFALNLTPAPASGPSHLLGNCRLRI